MNLLAKYGLTFLILTGMIALGASQTTSVESGISECQVIEAQGASAVSEDETHVLESEDVLEADTNVSTNSDGYILLGCDNGFGEVPPSSEGVLEDVIEETEQIETDIPEIEEEVDVEEALQQTDQIEENLDQVNEIIDETVPSSIASIIFGDKVNFQVEDTTIGIATNDSGVTEVEEEGYEDPTLEIKTDEQTLNEITSSEDAPETFREAYHGDGIDVEANSIKNKIVFGAVNTSSRIYGFVNNYV